MTKKYRCKINTPWTFKGQIFTMSISETIIVANGIFDPRGFPDLFEEVEEMSNEEKWAMIFERFLLHPSKRAGFFLDYLGYNADKAYEYIVEGKK